jgi:hypothetical protein
LAQITSYVAAQLDLQFCTHIYSVLIGKETARILRWDRTGIIVTEPIKYIQAEEKTYYALMEASVHDIPHCLTSGDITTDEYHATFMKDCTTAPWACYCTGAHFIPHQHYHLTLDVIGCTLIKFECDTIECHI